MHVGQLLNERYELLEQLGRGGMGEVWKARDRALPRYVAIKGLSEQSAAGAGNRRRLELEASNMAGLRHARIVPIIDTFTEDDQMYLVMDFIEGTDLQRAGSTGTLSESEKVAILTGVLEALTYLHEETTVVHRDLKPANVLLDRNNQPYVADFGIARDRLDTQATQTIGIIGSPPYMAPEVGLGKMATPNSDIWSFGAVALWLFTGRTPGEGIAEGNFAGALTDDIRAALSSRRPTAGDLLASFRLAQRDGMTAAVPTVVHHESPTQVFPVVPQPERTPTARPRRRWIPVLILVIALFAISGAAIALLRPGGTPAAGPSSPSTLEVVSPSPSLTQSPSPSETPSPTPTPSETPTSTPTPPETSTPRETPTPVAIPTPVSQEITEGRIEISSSNGQLGPALYDAGTTPGYEPYVYTASGRLGRTGCYAQWRVVNNGILLHTMRTPCQRRASSSEVYWPNTIRYKPGTVEVTADITTDWGASTTLKTTFEMVDN